MDYNNSSNQRLRTKLIYYVVLGLLIPIILFLLFLFFVIFVFPSDNVELLPAYPAAQELTPQVVLPRDFLGYECKEAFVGNNYKVYTTKDRSDKILMFYRQKAAQLGKKGLTESSGKDSSISTRPKNILCFEDSQSTRSQPTNVLALLNSANSYNAELIKNIFPDVPIDTTIIIIIQGYTYYI